jgi:type I restriction enzyme S subunit
MTPGKFLAQFGHIADSPDGVQKLRELILDLAVRGKLVPQDPNDEPASKLLRKITDDKARLIKDGMIKKQKPLPDIVDIPYSVPSGWTWSRLGNFVISLLSGGTPRKSNPTFWNGSIPWASVKDLGQKKFLKTTQDTITQAGLNSGSKLAKKGSILICTRMGLGKIAIADIDVAINQDLKAIKLSKWLDVDYFFHYFRTLAITGSGMTVAGIKQDELLAFYLPLPPLEEQKRIVEKVDQLMVLCDRLEEQQKQRVEIRSQTTASALNALVNSENSDDFDANWQRIAANFDRLIDSTETLKALRATILDLAVRGKLIPQDPNDESTLSMLDKIAAVKSDLVKSGEIKKPKTLPPINEDEIEWDLPNGWELVKFGLLAEFVNGDRSKNYPNKSEYVEEGVPWINTGHIDPNGRLSSIRMNYITQEKFDTLRSGKIQKDDLVYCLRGATFGKTSFVEPFNTGAIASSLMIIRPYLKSMNSYIFKYLVSPFGRKQIFRFDNGSAQPNLSANSVMLYAFPLPPFEEQKRIVAKVDQLMVVCDRLEAQLAARDALGEKFVASSTHHLLTGFPV